MNKLFITNQNSNHSVKFFLLTIISAAFILITGSFAAGQTTRIPIADANGNFSDFQVDGDRVKILSTSAGGVRGKIKIRLDADGDWWKMIRAFDKNNNYKSIEQENGGYKNRVEEIEFDTNALNDRFKLEFWKAKLLGVHTHMMTENFHKADFDGKVVTFVWQEGLESDGSDTTEDMTAPINETMKVDNKEVKIVSSENGTNGYATIRFQTGFSWWTAVKFFDRSGTAHLIQKVDGRYTPGSKQIKIPLNRLNSEVKLEFWTAKFLGAHTHIASKNLLRERFNGRVVTITWGNAVAPINYNITADGSRVTIRSSESGGEPGYAKIRFVTNKAWWTALNIRNRNGALYTTFKENGKYNRSNQTIKIKISDLPSNVKLEFWTAKAFGVHTFMTSHSIANDRFDGRIVTVTWNK